MLKIERIDHFVLTVASIDATCDFYEKVLGFKRNDPPNQPTFLKFGRQKINLHEVGRTFEPKAIHAEPGTADFCLITTDPIESWVDLLAEYSIPVEEGPSPSEGAEGRMTSIYFRDPDLNLVEISRYFDR